MHKHVWKLVRRGLDWWVYRCDSCGEPGFGVRG